MRVIRIAHESGGEVLYTSFSFESFSEIISTLDEVSLFFNSLANNSLVSGATYYGSKVVFSKTGLGYQLYSEIIQNICGLEETKIVTLNYIEDSLVTISFDEIYYV